jgi:hypothetical protein
MAPTSLVHPLLATFLELVHQSASDTGPAVALIGTRHDAFEVAFWPVPERYAHPADPLVGYLAPTQWDAIALLTPGWLRPLDDAAESWASADGPTRITALVDRHGAAISVIDRPDGPCTLRSVPLGWVPDALARALGLATPPPAESTAAWVEAQWLDRIAPGILGQFDEATTWDWLVARHPLAGDLPHPSPASLAARTFTAALDTPWSVLRDRNAPSLAQLHGGQHPMSGDLAVAPAQWFDDGAYSRWVMRQMPPLDLLLADLLSVMRADLGDALLDALVSVGPWS